MSARCYGCFRPESLCLCGDVVKVDNRTRVLVVQHPRERQHPFNTARLLELCLANINVVVNYDSALQSHPERLPPLDGAGLLYPHARARDITQLTADERPQQLVVLDGTWHQARTMYRDIPQLQALPHFTLPSSSTSEFLIRRQPDLHCLSSLEAVNLALSALEPETAGLSRLMALFRRMNARQAAVPQQRERERTRRRAVAERRLPRALIEDFDQLVVAYGELLPAPAGPRRLVAWVAERVATKQRFEAVLKVDDASAEHLRHMNLSPTEVARGHDLVQFAEAWQQFCRPDDILAVWTQKTLNALREKICYPRRRILLKAAYRNTAKVPGSLDEIIKQERLEVFLPDLDSASTRRWQRLANAVALAKFLNERGRSPSSSEACKRDVA